MFFPKELDFVEGFAGKGEVSSAFRKVACQVFCCSVHVCSTTSITKQAVSQG
jgi:hypothetical protein